MSSKRETMYREIYNVHSIFEINKKERTIHKDEQPTWMTVLYSGSICHVYYISAIKYLYNGICKWPSPIIVLIIKCYLKFSCYVVYYLEDDNMPPSCKVHETMSKFSCYVIDYLKMTMCLHLVNLMKPCPSCIYACNLIDGC